jgi:hypothetical protein
MNRYAIAVGLFLLLAVVGLFLIFSGDGPKESNKATPKALNEYAYDSSSEVILTTRGKINGDDIHRSIRITVARDYRRIDIIQGYEGTVINTQQYINNSEAYREFLYAINDAGFVKGRPKVTEEQARQAGKCPTGNLFAYEHNVGTEEMSELWSATCNKEMGTFAGNSSLIQTLFKAQITDYSKITSGVSL